VRFRPRRVQHYCRRDIVPSSRPVSKYPPLLLAAVGCATNRRLRSRATGKGRAHSGPERIASARAPCLPRFDAACLQLPRRCAHFWKIITGCLRKNGRIVFWLRRVGVNIAPVTGSTLRAMPIPWHSQSITIARCGLSRLGNQCLQSNERFNQFTIEQLAETCFPSHAGAAIASGFNRCNITRAKAGQSMMILCVYTRDRIETTSQVWLGLTAGCAVCHDHKYDRLSQKEFLFDVGVLQ